MSDSVAVWQHCKISQLFMQARSKCQRYVSLFPLFMKLIPADGPGNEKLGKLNRILVLPLKCITFFLANVVQGYVLDMLAGQVKHSCTDKTVHGYTCQLSV